MYYIIRPKDDKVQILHLQLIDKKCPLVFRNFGQINEFIARHKIRNYQIDTLWFDQEFQNMIVYEDYKEMIEAIIYYGGIISY